MNVQNRCGRISACRVLQESVAFWVEPWFAYCRCFLFILFGPKWFNTVDKRQNGSLDSFRASSHCENRVLRSVDVPVRHSLETRRSTPENYGVEPRMQSWAESEYRTRFRSFSEMPQIQSRATKRATKGNRPILRGWRGNQPIPSVSRSNIMLNDFYIIIQSVGQPPLPS